MTDIRKGLETAAVAMADFEGGSSLATLIAACAAVARRVNSAIRAGSRELHRMPA